MIDAGAEMANPPALAEEDQARVELYRLLGRLFAAPPDEALLQRLRQVDGGGGPLEEIWADLRAAAQAASAEALADEYYRLFIGLGRGEVVPYASVYLTGFLMEKPLADLREKLREFGIERQEGVAEPEDHAAALFETMGLLIEENRLGFQGMKEFFSTFIGAWMGRFFEDLAAAGAAEFYRPVSALGQRLIEIEQSYYSMPN